MQITYWKNFSKRKNSTKQPTGGTTIDVELKEDWSLESPYFILADGDMSINYFYAQGRYYYVQTITKLSGNRTRYDCVCDLLASYKSQIGSTKAYVVYSASQYNAYVSDNRIAVEPITTLSSDDSTGTTIFNPAGYFILSVVAGANYTGEFNTNYVLTASQLVDVADKFYDTTIQNALNTLFAGDPLRGACSLTFIPLDISLLSSITTSCPVHIAGQSTGYTALILGGAKVVEVPSVAGFLVSCDDFTDFEPYSYYSLNLPFIGMVNVPMQDIGSNSINLNIDARIDTQSGSILYMLKKGDEMFAQYSGACGINLPLSSNHMNLQGVITNTLSTVGSLASGNPLGAIQSTIGTVQSLMTPNIGQKGVQGGYSPILPPTDFILCKRKHLIADYDSTDYQAIKGRPLGEVVQINTLSGYVQTENASVTTNASQAENMSLNSQLDSGFYYE